MSIPARSLEVAIPIFPALLVLPVAFLVLPWGCGEVGGGSDLCVPGSSVGCSCSNGQSGAQVCNSEGGGFEPCDCAGAQDGDGWNSMDVDCIADCAGRTCGSDGCGGSCGHCSAGEDCGNGECVPSEKACSDSSDCPPGMYCAEWVMYSELSDGRCHDGGEGDPCYMDELCLSGFVCNDFYHSCLPSGSEGEICKEGNDCDSALYCADFAEGDGKCHDGSEGDPCEGDQDCLVGLYCASGVSTGDHRCHDGGQGDACGQTSECQTGLVCSDVSDTCEAPAGEGSPCERDEDCATGMYCADFPDGDDKCHDGSDGDPCDSDEQCIDKKCAGSIYGDDKCHDGSEGDPCVAVQDCSPDLLCNGYYHMCKLPGQEGEFCEYGDCGVGFYCADFTDGDDKCHDGSEGDPCRFSSDCAGSGSYCADFPSGDHSCHDGSVGDPCTADYQCSSGLECGGGKTCS